MASDQVYSQPDGRPSWVGRPGVSVLARHLAGLRVLDHADRGGGVVPHGRVALAVQGGALGEARLRGARLAVLLQDRHVDADRVLHLGAGQLGLPGRVEPAAAERVDHGVDRGQVLPPPGVPAQADPRHPLLGVMHLGGDFFHLVPGRPGGILMPAWASRSLRYIRNEDSP